MVETVDAPNHALHKHFVFIHRHQAAHGFRVDFVQQNHVGGAVAAEGFVRHQGFDLLGRQALLLQFGARFFGGFAAHKRFRLRKHVGKQDFVMAGQVAALFQAGNQINRRDVRALVQQLEKGVLTVNAGFAPNNRAGFGGHGRAVALHLFAVGFHVELLDEFGQAVQVLVVWRDDVAAAAVKIDIPNTEQP